MGAYLQLVTPGIPLLGAWIYSGPYAIPNYSVDVHGRLHEHDADRRVPRRRPAGGDLRDRADDGRAGGRARHGPRSSCGARTSSRSSRRRSRPGSRSTPATTRRRSTSCSSCSISTRIRAEQAGAARARRRRSSSASASPPTTRCAGSRPRGSSARSATRPAAGTAPRSASSRTGSVQVITGTSPHGQGHETAWAQIAADQLGVRHRRRRGAARRHGRSRSYGLDTYGSRSLPVGGVALWHAAEKVIEKARQIVAHQLEVSADDLEFANGDVLASRARPTSR